MRWADEFITADWGTTNRRAYLIDAAGNCTDEMEDGKGVLSVEQEQFGGAVRDIRQRLGDRPLLLAGMVGSNRGWVEAPYVPCPAGAEDLAAGLVWAEPERTAIVPGVCFADDRRADVMRGEEVQILGAAAAGTIPPDCLVCHPGTHNKWIRVERKRIVEFRSVMTGELFSLLRERSILSDLLKKEVEPDDAFAAGARCGLARDELPAELFAIRARVLLGKADPKHAAPYASGLLIGTDVRIGLAAAVDREVVVMGRPELTRLYSAAIRLAGREPRECDGEQAFIAGAARIVELIE